MNITFPLLLDGAMGTQLYKRGMPHGVCPEQWILNNPWAVKEIQSAYVAAGAQVLYAPTFGANRGIMSKYGLQDEVTKYNTRLVALCRESAGNKALVAGDISSAGSMLYPMGEMRFEDIYKIYLEQAVALEKAGVDLYVIETMTSIPEARAAVLAVRAVSQKPIFVTFTCDESGRTVMGSDVTAALQILQGMGINAFGLNCSAGPREMLPQIKRLAELSSLPLIAKPNAGLPKFVNGQATYDMDKEIFASYVPALIEAGANIIGGCCGTDEGFVSAAGKAMKEIKTGMPAPQYGEYLPCATEKDAFLLPADAICEQVFACDDDLEDNLSEAEENILIAVEINSPEDAEIFADAQYRVNNPLCIMCDDAALLEKALRAYQGRALYEGSLTDDELHPFVHKYGLIV